MAASAEAHIAKIRHDKGLSEQSPYSSNVVDLENALTTLSEQLYQSSTHFLLELIQNADDNEYAVDVQPSLNFTYTRGHLRVDCNEVGFTPHNVESLCRVGQSTKKQGKTTTGYVGEKGIGFKSVFKAADVVWISSRGYSFKFDKSRQLGMIAPIWAKFPVPVKEGCTSLYLQLAKEYDAKSLLDELRILDSRLLIFLRRLCKVTVSISEPARLTWTSSFSKSKTDMKSVRLIDGKVLCDYIVRTHTVTGMPKELKRQGAPTSQVILSFPVNEDGTPKVESQQVYAFLPVRDYGFHFLIQADFLLIASREDIDSSPEWNRSLRDGIFICFVDSIRSFHGTELAYTWIRYLPLDEPLQSFLKPVHVSLRQKLSEEYILHSQKGALVRPNRLLHIPQCYTFNGVPITSSSQNDARYLSTKYAEEDWKYLETLGVTIMCESGFLVELHWLIEKSPTEFARKSKEWHSHLADILNGLGRLRCQLRLRSLPIIPLADGKWVAADSGEIFFPFGTADFDIPGGLQLAVVDAQAAADPSREKLFRSLGVGELTRDAVVNKIKAVHERSKSLVDSLSRHALVAQIKFLYDTDWKNPKCQEFWFHSESGELLRGSQLYQTNPNAPSATTILAAQRRRNRFVHTDFSPLTDQNRKTWSKWLEEEMDVATVPRLVQRSADEMQAWNLSEDFELVLKTFPSSHVLRLLRDNWDNYSRFFDADQLEKHKDELERKYKPSKFIGEMYVGSSDAFRKGVATVLDRLRSLMVTCKDGKKHRLDRTFLPKKELLMAAQDEIPFLDIPDSNDSRWEVLQVLGVTTRPDVSFYIRSLEKLALEESSDGVRVASLMSSIQVRCEYKEDFEAVTAAFDKLDKKMIYIPPRNNGRDYEWVPLVRCRWRRPPIISKSQDLRTFTCLKDIYPECHSLFREILEVRDADIHDVLKEARAFKVGDELAYITSVYHCMEKMLEDLIDDVPDYAFKLVLFPVTKDWNKETTSATRLQTGEDASGWFIADTAPFRTIFAGVVPLLDIQVDDLMAMETVMRKAGISLSRRLSLNATSSPKTKGAVELRHDLTNAFRARVDFISRLIPASKYHRKRRLEVIEQLRNSQVYTAEEVIQEWQVVLKGKIVKGPPGNGQVALHKSETSLQVFLAAKTALDGVMPIELVDELFNFCGMDVNTPPHSEMCLHVALSQNDPVKIHRVFTDKGIPSLESLRFANDEGNHDDSDDDSPPRYSDDIASGSKKKSKQDPLPDRATNRLTPRLVSSLKTSGIALGAPLLTLFGAVALGGPAVKDWIEERRQQHKDASKDKSPAKEKLIPDTNPASDCNGSLFQSLKRLTMSGADVAFVGELAIHNILSEALGNTYNASHHWTSSRRHLHDNLTRYKPLDSDSNFCFKDTNGAFTHLLYNESCPDANQWFARPPTYHIDVKSTHSHMQHSFDLGDREISKAKEYSMLVKDEKEEVPGNVYIIARVYNVDGCTSAVVDRKGKGKEGDDTGGGGPKVVFLVDPWRYWQEEKLKIQVGKGATARIVKWL